MVELGVQMGTVDVCLAPGKTTSLTYLSRVSFSEVCRLSSFVIAPPGFILGFDSSGHSVPS